MEYDPTVLSANIELASKKNELTGKLNQLFKFISKQRPEIVLPHSTELRRLNKALPRLRDVAAAAKLEKRIDEMSETIGMTEKSTSKIE